MCWAAGVVLQVHVALSFACTLTTFYEQYAWQWLLAQLSIQCVQVPIRLDLYRKLGEVSRSVDATEATARIRELVTSRTWLFSQGLGTLFHCLAACGPLLLLLLPTGSSVRRMVMSLCCANLLIFILRTVLTFVIMHSILESRNSQASRQRRGLSAVGIRKLSRSVFSREKSKCNLCSICLGHFDDGDGLLLLPCDERHGFHEPCITQWLVKNNSCPLCQRFVPDAGDSPFLSHS